MKLKNSSAVYRLQWLAANEAPELKAKEQGGNRFDAF